MTKEEIQALAKRPYEELTSEERRLVNLNKGFWEKGQVTNPKGRKKGQRSWSVIFKRLMDDEKFLNTIVNTMPSEWTDVVKDTPGEVIAAGLIANVVKGIAQSLTTNKPLSKDVRDAISLLNKLGYGDKVIHEIDEGFFTAPVIKYEVVPDRTDIKKEGE